MKLGDVVVALKIALLSRVRHLPSETDRARFQTTTWSCSWGWSALLVKWVKAADHAGYVLFHDPVLARNPSGTLSRSA